MAILEKEEVFVRWVEDFVRRSDGILPERNWLQRVDKAHQKIRKQIGDVRCIVDIKLDKNSGCTNVPKRLLNELEGFVGTIVGKEGLNKAKIDFSILNDVTTVDNHKREVRTSRFIRRQLEKVVKDHISTVKKNGSASPLTFSHIMSTIDRRLSDIASSQLIADPGDEYRMIFTTSAKAFLLLGHYGPDNDSCFRNKRDNEHNKFTLGLCQDSAVIILQLKKKGDKSFSNISRYWAFLSQDHKSAIAVCNGYHSGRMNNNNSRTLLKLGLSKVMNTKVEHIGVREPDSRDDESCVVVEAEVYHNYKSPDFIFYDNQEESVEDGVVLLEPKGEFFDIVSCRKCGTDFRSNSSSSTCLVCALNRKLAAAS